MMHRLEQRRTETFVLRTAHQHVGTEVVRHQLGPLLTDPAKSTASRDADRLGKTTDGQSIGEQLGGPPDEGGQPPSKSSR